MTCTIKGGKRLGLARNIWEIKEEEEEEEEEDTEMSCYSV